MIPSLQPSTPPPQLDHMSDDKNMEKHASQVESHGEGQTAIDLVNQLTQVQIDPEETRALRWKIDLRLIPLLCGTYALQSIDKTTLSYAAVFDLRENLGLRGTEFSWLGALFYLGYLAWEFPTNVLLQRFPINIFMSSTVSRYQLVKEDVRFSSRCRCADFTSFVSRSCCGGPYSCATRPPTTSPAWPRLAPFSGCLRRPSILEQCFSSQCKLRPVRNIRILWPEDLPWLICRW